MIWRFLILGLVLVTLPQAFSQNGNFFLSNLVPKDERIDPRSTGMAQSDLGVIYFTNKNGILEFDGSSWRLIATPGSVYTISSSGNKLFAGGSFGFGVITPQAGEGNEFRLISAKPNVFSSLVLNDEVIFCSESEIFRYSVTIGELSKSTLVAGESNFFMGLHIIDGKPYVTAAQQGLLQIQYGSLSPSTISLPEGQTLIFSVTDGRGEFILGTEHGEVFRYTSSGGATPLQLKDSTFLVHHGLVNATWAGDNLVALGTLKGGVIFIDPKTGSTIELIDYNTGLPDNDVLSLFTDRNKGVWVAQEYGFTRIAPTLPFRSFNHYPGLSGNLLCVKEVSDTLFVGTSLGLYYLKTEEQYEDVEVLQRSTRLVKNTNQPVTQTKTTPKPTVVQQDKTRKKLFGFLRKKKDEDAPTTSSATDPAKKGTTKLVPKTQKPKTETVITKTTKKILKSRQYVYQKIEKISGKVTQLVEFNGKTIVSGLDGVFTLAGTQVTTIFNEPVRYVYHSATLNQLFISTFDDRTISLASNSNQWEETHYVDSLRDYISYIFEDHQSNIWFCGKTLIYKMELVDGAITAFKSIPIENPLFDETVGVALGHDVYIAASGNFKRYDGNDAFVSYDSLSGPKRYFASAGNFWFNDGHRWKTVSTTLQSLKLEWLGMFPNLRYLSPTGDKNGLWVVTARNELYRFVNPADQQTSIKHPLFLRDVRGDQIKLLQARNLRLDQSENTVYFEFTQPNYLGFQATEFRYMVHGLTKEWSGWSNVNNLIPFSYLPPGEYQLAVQSRDILGNESEVELVTFEVMPYYWKRWWFYASEFAFFTILVLLSIQLGKRDDRYKVISRILSLLTVILLIQFIETGINSMLEFKSSPVVEFLIQLGITLIVFPVESKLQQVMQRAKEGKYTLRMKGRPLE